ncbi:hypothetical protein [Adlercreutzia sp. ZJ138]|uniref:hypothetical protein n=1 Tax=Adlercreutzia sp. ZJ138 TaxID=2709405 RepID=UPI0013EB4D0E|nr:hypothetical protein [Adlercreutzia sp. ZJ138]
MRKVTSEETANGSIRIVIGPNGYGKTTYLNEEKARREEAGETIFFIPSEIKLLDEVKDTVDSSQTMEFLLTELLETPEYLAKRDALFEEADRIIEGNVCRMNLLLEEILLLNGSTRSKDFIAPNSKRVVKT